ncbi:MAG: hypothetical protein OES14_03830 [Nitrosopumilus sp.]|nr:hypothetical protein [Nitrosopumilus sp.]
MKNSDKNINRQEKSKKDTKQRELEQTLKFQVRIVEKLFDKVDKMKEEIQDSKIVEKNTYELDSKIKKTNTKSKSKFELSDLSWYKDRLDNSQRE